MFRTLYNLTCSIMIRKNAWSQPLQRYSIVTKTCDENNAGKKWFAQKEDEILQIVNTSTFTKLKRYIYPLYAKKIILNRNNSGLYTSVNDLLSKNEMSSDILDEFYDSIINCKMRSKKWNKFVVTPDVKTITMPETILGIHIGVTAITWTLMSNDLKVLDWDCLIWYDDKLELNTFNLMNLVLSFIETLPLSSSYVIEETHYARNSVLLNQQKMTIGILSCLKLMEKQRNDKSLKSKNSIYILKSQAAAYFFKLVINNEIISSKYITNEVLNAAKTNGTADVCINEHLKRKYTGKTLEEQEQIGWSLLKALTFVRLVTLFNTKKLNEQNV